jgi:hypothetical protein
MAAKALPRLSEYCSQFDFAVPEIAKELLKGIEAAWPSHELFKLVTRLFAALLLKKGAQRLIGHFQAIPQRKCLGPGNHPEGSFDLPRQLIFLIIEFVIHRRLLPQLAPSQFGADCRSFSFVARLTRFRSPALSIPSLAAFCRIKPLHDDEA